MALYERKCCDDKRTLIFRSGLLRRYGVMVAWNDKQFPQTTKNSELRGALFLLPKSDHKF